MAELTNNHKNLLRASIAGGVLLSGLFAWLGYQDYQAREEALRQVAEKRADLDLADAQIREIPKLEERIIVLRDAINEYVRILPDEKEINEFVTSSASSRPAPGSRSRSWTTRTRGPAPVATSRERPRRSIAWSTSSPSKARARSC